MAIGINDMKRAHHSSLVDPRIYGPFPFVNSLDISGPFGLDSAREETGRGISRFDRGVKPSQ
jgi:hypothetical protein